MWFVLALIINSFLNFCQQQAAQALAESVLSVARAEAIVAVTNENQSCSGPANDLSVVVHALRDSLSTTPSDLATIVETLALDDTSRINNATVAEPNSGKSLSAKSSITFSIYLRITSASLTKLNYWLALEK